MSNEICTECGTNTIFNYCKPCNSLHFETKFSNWTSGSEQIDNLIKQSQLDATSIYETIEWIPYEQFKNIEFFAEMSLAKVYRALWKEGPINYQEIPWDNDEQRWRRIPNFEVFIKKIKNSQNISSDKLKQLFWADIFGISRDPETNEYIIVSGESKEDMCTECSAQTIFDYCKLCNSPRFETAFSNWTSGNEELDHLIKQSQLEATSIYTTIEWIPYKQFENIEFLSEGGFAKVYTAIWKEGPIVEREIPWDYDKQKWRRKSNLKVVLKKFSNTQNISSDFVAELKAQLEFNYWGTINRAFGISRDPETNLYILVSKFRIDGSFRHFLSKNVANWERCLNILGEAAEGLQRIHEHGFIHRDVHSGNFLVGKPEEINALLTDLGLCRPANVTEKETLFGVLPFMAPELLHGGEYTQSTDVYGFSMVMYELASGIPPFTTREFDLNLAMDICDGTRPQIPDYVPECLSELIKKCWDADPSIRPAAENIKYALREMKDDRLSEFQILDEKRHLALKSRSQSSILPLQSQANFTSKRLNFSNLPAPRNRSTDTNNLGYRSNQLDLSLSLVDLQISD